MKKLICSLFLLCNSLAFCHVEEWSSQLNLLKSEIESLDKGESQEKSESRNAIVRSNLAFFERSMTKKMAKAEARLEKYTENLNKSIDNEEAQKWTRKIQSTEEKITTIQDVLNTVELWKRKL